MNKLSGVVERKGEQFNGSVKINGKFYNFKKGVDHSTLREGDTVTLELKDWEFKGKTGVNIASFTIDKDGSQGNIEPLLEKQLSKPPSMPQGRDFDAEARGKTRCQLVAASMPLVLTDSVSMEVLKAKVDELVTYIFEGK